MNSVSTIDTGALEAFYTVLLVLSAIVITWFSVFVVWRLFKGQR